MPASEIAKHGNTPPLRSRTRSFEELERLAIEGLNYHWGRNKNHFAGKEVKINNESYEVYVTTVNTKDKSMDDVTLIYNTNGNWMRSGNPGSVKDPMTFFGNIISREAICYNIGYIKYVDGWGYADNYHEDLEFKDTSAHEVGHEILKKYGGTIYSYGHKNSVNSVFQTQKDSAPEFPLSGEIDLMPYFKNNILGNKNNQPNYYKRRAAAEKDVLGLVWLSKIEVT